MLCLPFYLIIFFLNTQCVLKCLVHIRMCSYLIICVIFASVSLHLSMHKCLNAIFVLPFSVYIDFLFTHIVCTYSLVYTMMCTFCRIVLVIHTYEYPCIFIVCSIFKTTLHNLCIMYCVVTDFFSSSTSS